MLKKEILDVIACPKCKGKLHYDEKKDTLNCKKCRLLYSVDGGVPNMLVDEATKY